MYRYIIHAPLKMCLPDGNDLITPHPSPRRHLPLKLRRGRHFRGAFTPVPIRFLRLPDREQLTKPVYAERMNPFPTTICFCADLTSANGTGKPVPYKVRRKTQHRTCVTRNVMVSANVPNRAAAKRSSAPVLREATMVSTNVPNRATRDNRIRRCVNAPLKKRL